jgi:transcriptional regulator with XRE-family HTH domain
MRAYFVKGIYIPKLTGKIGTMNFSQYLELKFIEWQHQAGGRKTVADFAAYLGVAQTTASSYMNGKRTPEGDTLKKIADKLGYDVYDVLNIPRPDPDLIYIQNSWGQLDEITRRLLRQQAEKNKQKNLENESKRTHSKRKPRTSD